MIQDSEFGLNEPEQDLSFRTGFDQNLIFKQGQMRDRNKKKIKNMKKFANSLALAAALSVRSSALDIKSEN